MPERGDPVLEEIARSVAEGRDVDWEDLSASHPLLRARIARLRDLEKISRVVGRPEPGEAEPPPLRRWGALEILEKIGAGSFGEVYRAFDPLLEREVALKLAFARGEGSEAEFERHLEEARRLARVRHPHVVAIHGIEEHNGRSGIWTDLVRGETLEERLAREGPFTLEDLLRFGHDLCLALGAVHEAGIVHGDVKAANAMVGADGRAILMDFGAGTSPAFRDRPGRRALAGTPLALAPELLRRRNPPTPASDLYALGALLYRLATGRYPIEARSWRQLLARHRAGRKVPLREARPDLPETVTRAIETALAPDPSDRPESAAVLAAALRVAGGETPAAVDPHLPGMPTRFIGREKERRTIREAILRERLVTLAGGGGCGKTRLAHQATLETAGAFADGVRWVDLAPIQEPELVAQEIAGACEAIEAAGRPIEEGLGEALRERSVLLVLDNCEHLLAECARIVGLLLDLAPRLRVLATSRRRLGVDGEQVVRVPPMRMDGSSAGAGLEILEADVVRLFVDRAGAGTGGFVVTERNAPAVARICRLLDGIPLAIELAAPRVRILGVDGLADRLERDLGVLSDRAPGRPAHHRTLAAAIDWSVRLLAPAERTLFRRLAVFVGGWPPEAAEEVCGEDGRIDETPVLDLLANLEEASLVVVEPSDAGARHGMLETVRTFARARLAESGELPEMRDRHLAYVQDMADRAGHGLFGPEEEEWLARLEGEQDNLRAALDWAQADHVDPDLGMRIVYGVRRFWLSRGYLVEGLGHTRAMLAKAGGDGELRARVVLGAASLAWKQGRLDEAEELSRESYRIHRERGEELQLSGPLAILGVINTDRGDYAAAREITEEALAIHRKAGNHRSIPSVLSNLGVIAAKQKDLDAAERYYSESLKLCREIGDHTTEGVVLGNLSATAQDRGDLETARRFAQEALAVLRQTKNVFSLMSALNVLARIDREQGSFDAARAHALEALRIGETTGDDAMLLSTLIELVQIDLAGGSAERAIRLLGAVESLHEERRVQSLRSQLDDLAPLLASARASLGGDRYAAALADGRSLSWDGALALARVVSAAGS